MIDPSAIRKDMPVIGSDGETLGQVDGVEGAGADARIKLKRVTSPDGHHHFVAVGDVARVDEHVHLTRAAGEVRAGWMLAGQNVSGGAASGAAVHGAREIHVEGGRSWLPWILGSLALFALLVFSLRSCDNVEPTGAAPAENNGVARAPAATTGPVQVAEQRIALPNGGAMTLAPRTIGYDLQAYLASAEGTPRTFEFERLNFDTGRADVRAVDRATVDGIAQILNAYPAARVRLIGYADARGGADANADLGARRADAVKAGLVAKGVSADRIDTASGGETGAAGSNATAQGQAENRRTELVVLTK
jgi:outer membrane protein OmpA-like peptidoglycan-associated protein